MDGRPPLAAPGAVDVVAIARRASLAAGATVTGVRPLPGGLSGITLVAELGGAAGQRISLELFAAEVIPAVRDAAPAPAIRGAS